MGGFHSTPKVNEDIVSVELCVSPSRIFSGDLTIRFASLQLARTYVDKRRACLLVTFLTPTDSVTVVYSSHLTIQDGQPVAIGSVAVDPILLSAYRDGRVTLDLGGGQWTVACDPSSSSSYLPFVWNSDGTPKFIDNDCNTSSQAEDSMDNKEPEKPDNEQPEELVGSDPEKEAEEPENNEEPEEDNEEPEEEPEDNEEPEEEPENNEEPEEDNEEPEEEPENNEEPEEDNEEPEEEPEDNEEPEEEPEEPEDNEEPEEEPEEPEDNEEPEEPVSLLSIDLPVEIRVMTLQASSDIYWISLHSRGEKWADTLPEDDAMFLNSILPTFSILAFEEDERILHEYHTILTQYVCDPQHRPVVPLAELWPAEGGKDRPVILSFSFNDRKVSIPLVLEDSFPFPSIGRLRRVLTSYLDLPVAVYRSTEDGTVTDDSRRLLSFAYDQFYCTDLVTHSRRRWFWVSDDALDTLLVQSHPFDQNAFCIPVHSLLNGEEKRAHVHSRPIDLCTNEEEDGDFSTCS
jgi:hypothetical protein